jgi:hypothetical protein
MFVFESMHSGCVLIGYLKKLEIISKNNAV